MGAQGLYDMERFYYLRRIAWGLIVFWILFTLWATGVFAAPYLTCDCTPAGDAVTGFQLQFGAATPIDVPAFSLCETETPCTAPSVRICYDLVSLPAGPYSIKAAAKNVWGISTQTAPLSGSRSAPSSPSSLKIVP